MKVSNEDFIKNLSAKAEPFQSFDSLLIFLMKWVSFTIVFFGVSAYLLPFREGFAGHAVHPLFILNSILWLMTSVVGACAFYFSLFPESHETRYQKLSISFFALLTIILLPQLDFFHLTVDFEHELDLWIGRCGFLITAYAVVQATVMTLWAHRAAPQKPGHVVAWAAFSSASLGCLLMQAICFHDTPIHLLTWHFVPVVLLTYIGQLISRKIFHW